MEYSFEQAKIIGGIGADDEYWRSLSRGEFRLSRCAVCKGWMWPAHFRCAQCGAWELEWVEVEPRGTVFTWTRSWYAFDRVKERAEDVPYVTALVELAHAGGARVLGMFEGPDEVIRIGAPVRGEIRPPTAKSKNYPSIVWVPDPAAARAPWGGAAP